MEKIKGMFTIDQAYDLVCFSNLLLPIETTIFDGNDMDDVSLEQSKNELLKPFLEPGYKGHKSIVVLNEDENDFPGFCIIYPEIEESEDSRFDLYFAKKIEMESFDKLINELNNKRINIGEAYDSLRIIPSSYLSNEELNDNLGSFNNGMEEYVLVPYQKREDLQIGQVLIK